MRKLIWCCSAVGVLAAGGFLSLIYYSCRCPDSVVGRSMQVIAEASVAMQPLSGLTSLAMRTSQADAQANETPGSIEECIPEDPQPVAPEPVPAPEPILAQLRPADEREMEAAPIVIHEDDSLPHEVMVPIAPVGIDLPVVQGQEIPPNGCPIIMPRCQDDGELPVTPPKMLYAEENEQKSAKVDAVKTESSEKEDNTLFKEWMKIWGLEDGKEDKSATVEELPPPVEEEPQAQPKCQEDSHLHEHYSGCPRVTCPYSGKGEMEKHDKRTWDIDPKMKKKGKEECSEEPPQPGKKPQPGKDGKKKDEPVRTQGVDTMEYRPSDGGLNEYGPGPIQ